MDKCGWRRWESRLSHSSCWGFSGTTWLVQNLTRVGESKWLETIGSSQFGVEEDVFVDFENRGKGLQRGRLLYLSSSILKKRIT